MLIYRALSVLLFPFLELYLFWRVYKKKEDKNRLRERFGKATVARPKGDVIWIHAVSVGETNSALIFVDELFKKFPQTTVLFTTTTLTSAGVVATKIPTFKGAVIHQFLPIDSLFCVRNFLDFWQPIAAFFVESEIWPNLITETHLREIDLFLVNARMSAKSASKWAFMRKLDFRIFDCFDAIFAQSKEDQERLKKLSSHEVFFFGNLKSQANDLVGNEEELAKLQDAIGPRQFWLAASTHKGEEEAVLATHKNLKQYFPDLLTVLIPRHPNRADEIKSLFSGLNLAQRSKKENLTNSTEIYLADTLGELGTFYRLGKFTFLGGSLLPIGGHNPFEPIKLGCAVISGLHVFNFKETYANLQNQNACVMLNSAEELTVKVKEFLENPQQVETLINNGLQAIATSGNIAAKILEQATKIE